MKKHLTKLLVLMLIAALYLAPAQTLAEEMTHDDLVQEWMETLFDHEQMFAIEVWALDCARAFCENNSWDSLLRARAAASLAVQGLYELQFPEARWTAEDYLPFLTAGYELSFVPDEFALLEQARQDMLLSLTSLEGLLLNSIFWKYDLEYLRGWVEAEAETLRCEMMSYGALSNYICTIADESAGREAAASFYRENCPIIFAAYDGWIEDEDVLASLGNAAKGRSAWQEDGEFLEQLTSAILDAYEISIGKAQALDSLSTENLNAYRRCAESGDWSELAADKNEITGMPTPLPDPGWYDSETTLHLYYWADSPDGEPVYAQAGDMPDSVPAGCLVSFGNVSREAFDAYTAYLSALGLASLESETGVYFQLGEMFIHLSWADGSANIHFLDGIPGFSPVWYLMALLNE